MPKNNREYPTYPAFGEDLSGRTPEEIMAMFNVMADPRQTLQAAGPASAAPAAIPAAAPTPVPAQTQVAGPSGGDLLSQAASKTSIDSFFPKAAAAKEGWFDPASQLSGDDQARNWANRQFQATMEADRMDARRKQTGGLDTPSIDEMLRSMFNVGGPGGVWNATDEQRAFAARHQLEMAKMASQGRGDDAKLEAARIDAQTQREFQAGEAEKGRQNQLDIANMQYGPAQFKKNIYGAMFQENMKRFGNDVTAATAETEKQMQQYSSITDQGKPGQPASPSGTQVPVASLPPSQANPSAGKINELLPRIGTFGPDRPFSQDEAHKILELMSTSGLGDQDRSEIARRISGGTLLGDPQQALQSLAQAYARSATYASGKNDTDLNLDDKASLYYRPRSLLGETFRLPQHAVGAAVPNRIRIPTGEDFPVGSLPAALPLSLVSPQEKDNFLKQAQQAALLFRAMAQSKQQQGR